MLTGRPRFQRETAAETMTAILKEEPSGLGGLEPAIPSALERIVRHCLEKKPEQRFQSSSDIAFALDSLSASGAAEVAPGMRRADPERSRLSERLAFATGGALIAAAIAVLLLLPRHGGRIGAPLPPMRFAIPPPTDMSLQGMLALSPMGSSSSSSLQRRSVRVISSRARSTHWRPAGSRGRRGRPFRSGLRTGARLHFSRGGS